MGFMAENGRYLFKLFIIPNIPEILWAIFAEGEIPIHEFIYRKPPKLKHETRSIFLSLSSKSGISFFTIILW